MFNARRGGCADHHRLRHPAASDDSPYVETDPSGRYGRFEETLGKGAMKTVYRAFDELQGVEVAWNQAKICDVLRSPEALERLYSEVHLLSTLGHESIIQFHASWVDAGRRTFNFITEMFTSGTLREYRQRYRRVDLRAVKKWARQILNGLVYLHRHDPPVIHRDLKCDNIFVNGHLGQVKIGDLGLAAVLRGSQLAHSVIGTPEFMAPELYEEEYNELVDVYSFGMCVLEMLTGEYPYSECSNPAQIYKKVTSGKLPEAFHRVPNLDARRFIGRCLENVTKRASAAELLDDPFLQVDYVDPAPCLRSGFGSSIVERPCTYQPAQVCQNRALSSEMKITGKMNPEDDTILLRVQISDRNGLPQNIYFPFDILSDTPIDVANEMVKELEIDRDPAQIAKVIDQEISALVPHWREEMPYEHQHNVTHVYNYHDDDDDNHHHHQFYMSSPTSSSHGSSFGHLPLQGTECLSGGNWFQGFHSICKADDDDDDTTSQISITSANYSYVNVSYSPSTEQDALPSPQGHKSSRFHPDDYTSKFNRQCSLSPEPSVATRCPVKRPAENNGCKLPRNRSLVDIRSQLLHQSLVEEVNKRLFNTVGSMENIGYVNPYEISSNKGKKTGTGASRGR